MRLTELDPRWLRLDGRTVALIFKCPHCRECYLSCFFEPMPVLNGGEWPSQFALFEKEIGEDQAHETVPCNASSKWVRTGDDLNTISIMPSLDASASGHWHGYVTDGEC